MTADETTGGAQDRALDETAAAAHPCGGGFDVDPHRPWRVVASGEVDMEVAVHARAHWSSFAEVSEVDLSSVTFMDSAGLGLLMSLARPLHRLGRQRLRVVGAPRQVRTMLALLGAGRVLTVVD